MNKSTAETRAFSIAGFCQAYGISRASFYNLAKSGNAPKTFKVGRRVLISATAAEQWVASREAA